jgi:hypothetical protein
MRGGSRREGKEGVLQRKERGLKEVIEGDL